MTRFLILVLLVAPLFAQQPETGPDFSFGTPEGWRGEVITLPPGFAPDLGWKGVENIRFAPGMFQPKEESFFSYLLVFLLEKDAAVSEAAIQKQVLTYYRGLAQAVGKEAISADEIKGFKLALTKQKELGETAPLDGKADGMGHWTGSLDWIEPFRTKKPQTLNMDVHVWSHGEGDAAQPAIYFAVSPQAPDHPVWKKMRGYRKGFTFTAK